MPYSCFPNILPLNCAIVGEVSLSDTLRAYRVRIVTTLMIFQCFKKNVLIAFET